MSIYKTEEGKERVLWRYDELLELWPVENKKYKVDTSHGVTFVIESGDPANPPVLLLHGSVSNSFCWLGDVEILSRDFNVYAIDLIGEAGYSDPNRPTYESGAYAEWLREVIEGLGHTRVSLVGLSLGGWMVLNFAVKYNYMVDSMALLCPGGLHPQRKSFLVKAIFYSLLGKWGSKQLVKMLNGGKEPDENAVGMKEAMDFTTLIGKNFNPRMESLPVYTGASLENLDMPVLTVFGDKDCILNGEGSLKHIGRYGQQVTGVLLSGTGHVVVNQATRIAEFFKRGSRKK